MPIPNELNGRPLPRKTSSAMRTIRSFVRRSDTKLANGVAFAELLVQLGETPGRFSLFGKFCGNLGITTGEIETVDRRAVIETGASHIQRTVTSIFDLAGGQRRTPPGSRQLKTPRLAPRGREGATKDHGALRLLAWRCRYRASDRPPWRQRLQVRSLLTVGQARRQLPSCLMQSDRRERDGGSSCRGLAPKPTEYRRTSRIELRAADLVFVPTLAR